MPTDFEKKKKWHEDWHWTFIVGRIAYELCQDAMTRQIANNGEESEL
jgi:hypothetical protein